MKFSLATLTRQAKNPRRSRIPMRAIKPPRTLAQELFAVTRAVPDAWTASEPQIVAAYERALSAIMHDSAEGLGDTIEGLSAALNALILRLTPRLRDWTIRVERWHRQRWTANVLSATAVDLTTMLSPIDVQQTVAAALEWNAALVADVSAEVRRRISSAVFSGLQERKAARDVAREIREATGMARDRSLRIAADQSVKLAARLDQARQEQAGIATFLWQWSHKKHGREEHIARDGQEFPWSGDGAPSELPGVLPFCGCVAAPVLSLDD